MFAYFSSADFIQANGIYMWKSKAFAICKVTIRITKFMVKIMAEFHVVYLAVVVITIVKLRVC